VALRKHRRTRQKFVPPKLMLTSMMDMFTIILIFLIFSFSENPENMQLGDDLELPSSNTEAEYSKAIKIILSKKDLRINDEIMAEVQDHQIMGMVADDLKSSALYQRLKTSRQEFVPPDDDPDQTPHVLFLCDKSYSFKTINQVIKTAGMAGYPNFQFAVLEEK
jgi:biopolymer transport protein ExbD